MTFELIWFFRYELDWHSTKLFIQTKNGKRKWMDSNFATTTNKNKWVSTELCEFYCKENTIMPQRDGLCGASETKNCPWTYWMCVPGWTSKWFSESSASGGNLNEFHRFLRFVVHPYTNAMQCNEMKWNMVFASKFRNWIHNDSKVRAVSWNIIISLPIFPSEVHSNSQRSHPFSFPFTYKKQNQFWIVYIIGCFCFHCGVCVCV